MVSFHTSPI